MDEEPADANYFDKYKNLKRKLHFLLYENQSYQDELRQSQKKLLQVTRDKNFLLERLMKYEGVSSDTDSDDEKQIEDKSRQGFSPAPPSFKRPNVLAVTPAHTPSSITMPSPRGIMQSPSYGSPKPNHSPTLPSPSTTYPSPVPTASTSPKNSPRSRKASSNDINKVPVRKLPYPPPEVPKPVAKPMPPISVEETSVFCTHIDNGIQCTTEITKKSKTKLCGAHRRMLNKKKKQQNAGEEVVHSPNPHTPSSTIIASPSSQSPLAVTGSSNANSSESNMAHTGMMQSPLRNFRTPQLNNNSNSTNNTVSGPGYSAMFSPQTHPSQAQMHMQMQQYQMQMKRMMFTNNKDYYSQQQHLQQLHQQQLQQEQQKQQQIGSQTQQSSTPQQTPSQVSPSASGQKNPELQIPQTLSSDQMKSLPNVKSNDQTPSNLQQNLQPSQQLVVNNNTQPQIQQKASQQQQEFLQTQQEQQAIHQKHQQEMIQKHQQEMRQKHQQEMHQKHQQEIREQKHQQELNDQKQQQEIRQKQQHELSQKQQQGRHQIQQQLHITQQFQQPQQTHQQMQQHMHQQLTHHQIMQLHQQRQRQHQLHQLTQNQHIIATSQQQRQHQQIRPTATTVSQQLQQQHPNITIPYPSPPPPASPSPSQLPFQGNPSLPVSSPKLQHQQPLQMQSTVMFPNTPAPKFAQKQIKDEVNAMIDNEVKSTTSTVLSGSQQSVDTTSGGELTTKIKTNSGTEVLEDVPPELVAALDASLEEYDAPDQ